MSPLDRYIQLSGFEADADTRKLFAELMKQADTGDLVGAIVVALCKKPGKKGGKQYFLSLSGWAANNPTFAAGAMGACQVLLHQAALKKAGLT